MLVTLERWFPCAFHSRRTSAQVNMFWRPGYRNSSEPTQDLVKHIDKNKTEKMNNCLELYCTNDAKLQMRNMRLLVFGNIFEQF